MINQHAEVEVKVELSAEAFARMPVRLAERGFTLEAEETLQDHYLTYTPSPVKGYDLTRIRCSDGQACVLTEKRWVTDAQGQPVRLEEERELSAEECRQRLATAPQALSLEKRRVTYQGQVAGCKAHVVLDSMVLRGQPSYYVECEVLTAPTKAAAVRQAILDWLRETLEVEQIVEAPSMLELLLRAAKEGLGD